MYLLSFLSYLSFSFNLLPLAFALVPGSFHKDVTRPSHFRLKSRAIGNNNATISNLYVSSLHTEANDSDIVLRSFSDAFTASLKVTPNGTLLQFDRPTGFPWWMKIKGGSDGAAWGPVIIDAVVTNATTPDTPGFSFGGSGLQVDPSQFPGFKGWLGEFNFLHILFPSCLEND